MLLTNIAKASLDARRYLKEITFPKDSAQVQVSVEYSLSKHYFLLYLEDHVNMIHWHLN